MAKCYTTRKRRKAPRIRFENALLVAQVFFLIVLGSFALSTVVFAADTSDAQYLGIVRITNNSTAETAVSVPCTIFTQELIDAGFISTSCNNTATLTPASADVAYMPAVGSNNEWVFWVPSIANLDVIDYRLYTGGANDMAGKIRYFPDTGGMASIDTTSLEPSANFTFEQSGWVDTDNGTDKNLVFKEGAFRTFVSETVSGNITSTILDIETSPTSDNDPATAWANDAQAWNDNTADYATESAIADDTWSEYLEFHRGAMTVDEIRYYCSGENVAVDAINLDAFYDGGWQDVYQGAFTHSTWETKILSENETVSACRISLYNNGPAVQDGYIHDVDFNQNISVTATGVSSGEYTVKVEADGTFFGIGIDQTNSDSWPISENLTLNAPLYHIDLNTNPFATKDVYEHSCSVSGAVWTSMGRTFDDTDDFINCGNNAILNFTSGDFTIITWIKPSDLVADTEYILMRGDDTNKEGYYFYTVGDVAYFRTLNGATFQATDTTASLTTTWQMITVTRDGTAVKIFRNTTDITDTAGTHTDPDSSTEDFLIGIYWNESSGPYGGVMGEMLVYSQTFTPTEIGYTHNATRWKYDDSATYNEYDFVGAGVPDNSTNWTYYENMGAYWEYTDISVNGTQVQYIEWENAATFSDPSGYGNDATPTFRTTSSDPNVSAELISFRPIAESEAEGWDVTLAKTMIGAPTAGVSGEGPIPEMFTENVTAHLPGAGFFNAMIVAGGVSWALFWIPFCFIIVIVIGVLTFGATRSLGVQAAIMAFGIAFFATLGPIPFVPVIIFVIDSVAVIMMSKQIGW